MSAHSNRNGMRRGAQTRSKVLVLVLVALAVLLILLRLAEFAGRRPPHARSSVEATSHPAIPLPHADHAGRTSTISR